MFMKIIFGFLLICTGCCLGGELPAFIKQCYRNDPNVNDCLLENANNVLPKISKGIPELGVGTMDPLFLEHIDTTSSGLKFTFVNSTMRGFSKAQITKFSTEIKRNTVVFKLAYDYHPHFNGKYILSGNFLLFNVDGQGDYTFKFGKTHCAAIFKQKLHTNDGEKYATIVPESHKCIPGKGPIHFDNLFGGNKVLGDTVNQLLNDNFDILTKEGMEPITDLVMTNLLKELQKLYDNVAFDKVFPENAPESN